MSGIASVPITAVPIAVVDIETTGLHAGGDRIIEIAIVRIEPGAASPQLVLETLVHPRRKVTATEIHGITDDDVRDAPTFDEIAPLVATALSGAVFAAYNVYFDAKFVGAELERAGIPDFPPHLCLMYMRPLLGLGSRCSLADACRAHNVHHDGHHLAAADAMASARLWVTYLREMHRMQIRTFGDLARGKSYKFIGSFAKPPIQFVRIQPVVIPPAARRAEPAVSAALSVGDGRAEYWDALKAALVDLQITSEEIDYLAAKRSQLELSAEDTRALHARAFAGFLADVTDDHLINDEEVGQIASLATALRRLGWSPGDSLVATQPEASITRGGILARLLGR